MKYQAQGLDSVAPASLSAKKMFLRTRNDSVTNPKTAAAESAGDMNLTESVKTYMKCASVAPRPFFAASNLKILTLLLGSS
jgi:hypothetical protein